MSEDHISIANLAVPKIFCPYCRTETDGHRIITLHLQGEGDNERTKSICLTCVVKALDKLIGEPEEKKNE